jgi:hypothetical protein
VGLVFGSSCPRTGGRGKYTLPKEEKISDCEGNRKIARAKNSGGAAGGGAVPEHSEAEGRAIKKRFDIFCKRSASKKKKAAKR